MLQHGFSFLYAINYDCKKKLGFPANTLRKPNVTLWLYSDNLRKLLSANVVLRNLNYIRNPIVVITLAQLT